MAAHRATLAGHQRAAARSAQRRALPAGARGGDGPRRVEGGRGGVGPAGRGGVASRRSGLSVLASPWQSLPRWKVAGGPRPTKLSACRLGLLGLGPDRRRAMRRVTATTCARQQRRISCVLTWKIRLGWRAYMWPFAARSTTASHHGLSPRIRADWLGVTSGAVEVVPAPCDSEPGPVA